MLFFADFFLVKLCFFHLDVHQKKALSLFSLVQGFSQPGSIGPPRGPRDDNLGTVNAWFIYSN